MPKLKKLWRSAPTQADLDAAGRYLSLLFPRTASQRLVHSFSRSATSFAIAKDLLRASKLPLLPREESHVREDLKRIHKGKAVSLVLLVRGDMTRGNPLIVADGYHRICATCYFDEDAPVAYRIADPPR
jgi:hypothetical protein